MNIVKGLLAGVTLSVVSVLGSSSVFAAEGSAPTSAASAHHRSHHKSKHAGKTVAAHHATSTKDAHSKPVAASSKVSKSGIAVHGKKSTHGVVLASAKVRSAAHTTTGKAVDTKKAAGKHVTGHKGTTHNSRTAKLSAASVNPITVTGPGSAELAAALK